MFGSTWKYRQQKKGTAFIICISFLFLWKGYIIYKKFHLNFLNYNKKISVVKWYILLPMICFKGQKLDQKILNKWAISPHIPYKISGVEPASGLPPPTTIFIFEFFACWKSLSLIEEVKNEMRDLHLLSLP